jgi:serine/threonine protein kinase
MAPEVIKGEQLSEGWMKSDVWSLGCTLVELISGGLPFAEFDNPMTAMYQIACGRAPVLPVNSSAEAHSFVATCCAFDPAARPSISELFNHPFITKFVDTTLDGVSIGGLFNRLAANASNIKDVLSLNNADNIEASTGSELNDSAQEVVISTGIANETPSEGQPVDGTRGHDLPTDGIHKVANGSANVEENIKFRQAALTIKLEPSVRSGTSSEELLRDLETPKVTSHFFQSAENVFFPEPLQDEEELKTDHSSSNQSDVARQNLIMSDFETFYAASQAENPSQLSSKVPNILDLSLGDKLGEDSGSRNSSLLISGVCMPLEPPRLSPRAVKSSPRDSGRGTQLNEYSNSGRPPMKAKSKVAGIDVKPVVNGTKNSGASASALDNSINVGAVESNFSATGNIKKKSQAEAAATNRLDPVAPVLVQLPQIKDKDRKTNGGKREKVILLFEYLARKIYP